MKYQAGYFKHSLQFKKTSRTSRGELNTHETYILKLTYNNFIGYGEAAPLKGLSIDYIDSFEVQLKHFCQLVNDGFPIEKIDFTEFPSIEFAFETALLGINNQQPFKLFDTPFFLGNGIDINGLVWMNHSEQMLNDALHRLEEGFSCIKFKVGALDFDEECRMLERFRKIASPHQIQIRLDANGAFTNDDVRQKLKELKRFTIHSIEQPVKQHQHELMQEVCASSTISVALDEELIGISVIEKGESLLKFIQPQFIILKPTLVGGLRKSNEWIKHANKLDIGWWATSALESNIGLNAIAQWCSTYQLKLPQGLGTGSLYTNNIASPLTIQYGKLNYNQGVSWVIPSA